MWMHLVDLCFFFKSMVDFLHVLYHKCWNLLSPCRFVATMIFLKPFLRLLVLNVPWVCWVQADHCFVFMIEFPQALHGWYNCSHPLRLTVPFFYLFSFGQCRHTETRCTPPLLDFVHLNVSIDALALGFVSYWRTLLAARSRCILDNWWNLFVAFIGGHNILLNPSNTFLSEGLDRPLL